MAHQSLYRTYRPQTFDDVVGQQHIERTLRNAVAEGSVAHAYLFTGPRGTGKTTTARLLAKALDCEKGPTGEPDGTCPQCIEIAEGRHPDVYELDAASRTGVDNVREEIIGRVQFAPTQGTYKVYIIDEVHMLSAAAFNALLKTLEEPPSHVVFILATTHPHKVPETIQSRCQRFDFHRIPLDEIVGRLRFISDSEGFQVDDAALTLIARHASGGMRDAITTLEQLAAFSGGRIGLEDVEGLLGEVDAAQLFEIAGLVARRDIAGCFRWVARFAETGTDLAEFVRGLTGHVRNLYLTAAVGDAHGIIDATAEEIGRFTSQAAEFGGPDRLARVLDLLGELAAEMRWSSDPRLSLEVALTRMARPDGEMTLEALAERVEMLERGRSLAPAFAAAAAPVAATAPASPTPAKTAQASVAEPPKASAPATPAAPAPREAAPAPAAEAAPTPEPALGGARLDRAAARRAWQAVVVEIRKLKPARAQLFSQVEVDVDLDGSTLVIEFPAEQRFSLDLAGEPEMRDVVKLALAKVLGDPPAFRYQLGVGAVRPLEPEDAPAPVAAAAPAAGGTRSEDSAAGADAEGVRAPGEDPERRVAPAASAVGVAGEDPERRVVAPAASAPGTDLEHLLTHGLGATIVAEHAHEPEAEYVSDEDLFDNGEDSE